MVENVVCKVPTQGKINNKQPYFVIAGKAKEITIENNIALIT